MLPKKIHSFEERLKWSESKSDENFWLDAYRGFFPNMIGQTPAFGNHESQRAGTDRVIVLSNNRVLRIDEKKREKAYSDIALEFIHTKEQPWQSTKYMDGWIEKNLIVDYIAYAFLETKTVYFLDWLLLRRAWVANGAQWKLQFRIATAKNLHYYSHSVCVPITVLFSAMNASSKVIVP